MMLMLANAASICQAGSASARLRVYCEECAHSDSGWPLPRSIPVSKPVSAKSAQLMQGKTVIAIAHRLRPSQRWIG